MDEKFSPPNVSLVSFNLPFMEIDPNEDATDEEGEQLIDDNEIFELMDEAIPSTAHSLGELDYEVENWTTWRTRDHYYVIPIEDDNFDWGLFRISWDDNYGCWGWSGDARISHCKDQVGATRHMLEALFVSWGHDLADEESPHRQFLDSL